MCFCSVLYAVTRCLFVTSCVGTLKWLFAQRVVCVCRGFAAGPATPVTRVTKLHVTRDALLQEFQQEQLNAFTRLESDLAGLAEVYQEVATLTTEQGIVIDTVGC